MKANKSQLKSFAMSDVFIIMLALFEECNKRNSLDLSSKNFKELTWKKLIFLNNRANITKHYLV